MARPLTEEQYLRLDDPSRACNQFNSRTPLKTSTRKVRLFCCACCRRVWDWLGTDANRAAVEAAERAADGLLKIKDLRPFYDATTSVQVPLKDYPRAFTNPARDAAWPSTWPTAWMYGATRLAGYNQGGSDRERERQLMAAERAAQCALIHDLLGNPFRPVPVDRAWFTPAAVRVAQAAYDERHLPSGELDRARLLVLSDAVEDAGCTEERILAHLRSEGPHVRGCWAVDLVLGKS